MNMSTHIYGIVPPNDEWLKMKDAFDACRAAGVEPPSKIWDYFEGEAPDDSGILINIENNDYVVEFNSEECHGFEVEIGKIDPKIKIIRVLNCY